MILSTPAPMMTRAERVQLAIRFAQIDLEILREEDWRIFQHELWWFLTLGTQQYEVRSRSMSFSGGDIIACPHPFYYPLSKDDLRAIQKDTRQLLDAMLKSREGPILPPHAVSVRIDMCLQSIGRPTPYANGLIIYGPPRDIFYSTLVILLNRDPTDRIQRCPECRTIFYRIRKQKYCCHVCANRVSVRRWRKSEAGKQAEAERSHQRYATKRKPAQVTRRPRKGSTSHVETTRANAHEGEDPAKR
jgi:hypothetical protein